MLLISIFTAFTLCSGFLEYSRKTLEEAGARCPDPNFFIQMAAEEEDNPENRDKIILYHGQTVGLWLTQLVWKFVFYPEAPEDWLPLRLNPIDQGLKLDKKYILKMIKSESHDHNPNVQQYALSVSPNLVSNDHAESAWSWACDNYFYNWDRVSGGGLKSDNLMMSFIMNYIKHDLQWHFAHQFDFIRAFVQYKGNYKFIYSYYEIDKKFPELFPKSYHLFPEYRSVFEEMTKVKKSPLHHEGVFLQIIMDEETADELCYDAHPFGYLKSSRHEKFIKPEGIYEDHDDIEPYSEVYHEVKNKKDSSQARITLTNAFRSWPSNVKIKAFAGIMKNKDDYNFLKALFREMALMNEPVNPESKESGYRRQPWF